MTLGDAAVGIASESGWSIFPLQPGRKVPATRRGLHAATTDPELIGRWWQRCPSFNIGINCGMSRLLVVDLDVKTVDGLGNWFALASQFSSWIDTLVVSTPSGGEHWYFELGPGWGIGNSAGKLDDGIDVRCQGGYVVAPPSLVDGDNYEVLSDAPVAPAPDWLIAQLVERARPRIAPTPTPGRSSSYGQAALEDELGRLALALEGTRNDSLNRAALRAGQLAAGGQLDPVHAAEQLHAVALRIGLGDKETVATIRSGMTAGARQPRSPAA